MRVTIRKIYMLVCIIISAVLLCACSYVMEDADYSNSFNIHFLDVGQGDSIFIEIPNGETMLIDSGENGLGEDIIDYIEGKNHNTIDYLVATHPHSDHIGSMAYIVENFDIGKIYMPKVSTNTKTFENLLTSIDDKKLKISEAKAGVTIADNDTFTAQILAPTEIDENNLNNCSAVIKVTYGETSFLFTGDAEMEELEEIDADLSADVLKVGHHGSRTSTNEEFMEKVSPSKAVISVGKDNPYNHPHQEVLDILEQYTDEIYRTDKDKTIVMRSTGDEIIVETREKSIR